MMKQIWCLNLLTAVMMSSCAAVSAGPATPAAVETLSAEALFQRGLDARRVGDNTRAEQYLAAALEHGYPAKKGFPVLLDLCLATDRFDTALYYARARLLHQPHDWTLRYLVATLHLAAGQEGRAIPEIERLIDEEPRRSEPHYLHAVVARDHLRDSRLAAHDFRQYLALAPTGPHAAEARAFLRRSLLPPARTEPSR